MRVKTKQNVKQRLQRFLLRDADMHSAYLLRQRGWLPVTRRYCIKRAKPILKLFQTSGSIIILVSSDPCADTKFQGNSFSGGWEKLVIFDGNLRLFWKRCEIGR